MPIRDKNRNKNKNETLYDEGKKEEERRNYLKAFKKYKEAAKKFLPAKFAMARLYLNKQILPYERACSEKDYIETAFIHSGFWQPMDTLYQKKQLEDLWKSGEAPWKIW